MRLFTSMLLLLALAAPASGAEPERIGTASIVLGKVQVRHAGAEKWGRLQPGEALFLGDRIRTAASSSARLKLNDGSSMSMAAASELELNEFVYKPQGERRSFFKLWSGKVKAAVSKYLAGRNKFELGTPTAVAGVRGTEFVVETGPEGEGSTVTVLEGSVDVRSSDPKIPGNIVLAAGGRSQVGPSLPPGAALMLDEAALRALDRSVSVKGKGSARSAVTRDDAESAAGDFGFAPASGAPNLGGGGLPPINQQPTDARRPSSVTIRIHLPDEK